MLLSLPVRDKRSQISRTDDRPPTPRSAVRRALREKGVNPTFGYNLIMVGIAYVDRNGADSGLKLTSPTARRRNPVEWASFLPLMVEEIAVSSCAT
jgi:hypothetical protein